MTSREARPGHPVTLVAVFLAGLVLAGCQTFDERADHGVCGDEPDATCAEDGAEVTEETMWDRLWRNTLDHLFLVAVSLFCAILLGIPLGLLGAVLVAAWYLAGGVSEPGTD